MIIHRNPIEITTETDLDALLDEAAKAPMLLERHGRVYRLSLKDDDTPVFVDPDPEEVRRTLREVAGSWADLDIDQVIEDVYKAREEGSRPIDRP